MPRVHAFPRASALKIIRAVRNYAFRHAAG